MPDEIQQKIKEIAPYLKEPIIDNQYFSNQVDERDSKFSMQNVIGCLTSEYDDVQQFAYKNSVLKRGVKLDFSGAAEGVPVRVIPCTSDDDAIAVCVDYDMYSGQAQVKMLNQTWEEILVAKKGSNIKRNDKLKFVAKGEVDKQTNANSNINMIAMSDPYKKTEDLFFVHVAINGYKGK